MLTMRFWNNSFHRTFVVVFTGIILLFCLVTAFLSESLYVYAGTDFAFDIFMPEVHSLSAILLNADSGEILYGKDIHGIYYPASVTKIMTALLAVEHYEDYSKRIEFSWDAVYSLPSDSSSLWMQEGETLSAEDAMYGLMLASANDIANALAEDIAGSIEDFAVIMNNRARKLGTKNTSFENPHGLFGEAHYTTSYDLALIMREAVKNSSFIKYISTKRHIIQPTEKYDELRYLANSNKMIMDGTLYYNEDVIGGKTGYIDEAKHTLVTYAKRGGVGLIAVVLHGEKYEPYVDTKSLLDYGFGLYE